MDAFLCLLTAYVRRGTYVAIALKMLGVSGECKDPLSRVIDVYVGGVCKLGIHQAEKILVTIFGIE